MGVMRSHSPKRMTVMPPMEMVRMVLETRRRAEKEKEEKERVTRPRRLSPLPRRVARARVERPSSPKRMMVTPPMETMRMVQVTRRREERKRREEMEKEKETERREVMERREVTRRRRVERRREVMVLLLKISSLRPSLLPSLPEHLTLLSFKPPHVK